METLEQFRSRASITPKRLNPVVREVIKRRVIAGDPYLMVNETPQGTAIRLAVDVLLARIPKLIGQSFFAEITAYDAQTRYYTWIELEGDRQGTEALDVYDGGLSLIGETVLMSKGADGKFRFCWDRAFEAEMTSCDSTVAAYVEDPWDEERQILVQRAAGFYEVGDRVLCVAAARIVGGAYKWTIADRLPLGMREPLEGETTGNSSNEAAPVQDDPGKAGCDA